MESEIVMFNNIGSKIQSLAKTVCWIGIVASVILGIVLMNNEAGFLSVVVIIIGSLVSWVSSFCLYGFGDLVTNTAEIAKNTRRSKHKDEIISNNNHRTKKCPHCGAQFDFNNSTCPDCGHQVRIIQKGEEGNTHYNE